MMNAVATPARSTFVFATRTVDAVSSFHLSLPYRRGFKQIVVESIERAEGAIDGMALGHLAACLPHLHKTCQAPGIIFLGLSIALMQKKRPALSHGQVPCILQSQPPHRKFGRSKFSSVLWDS